MTASPAYTRISASPSTRLDTRSALIEHSPAGERAMRVPGNCAVAHATPTTMSAALAQRLVICLTGAPPIHEHSEAPATTVNDLAVFAASGLAVAAEVTDGCGQGDPHQRRENDGDPHRRQRDEAKRFGLVRDEEPEQADAGARSPQSHHPDREQKRPADDVDVGIASGLGLSHDGPRYRTD